MDLDLQQINADLRDRTPSEIVTWALALQKSTINTTSFGRNAAVMLHLVSEQDKSVPVVWVDTGYNLRDTYLVAEKLIRDLELNMHIYSPEMTSERRNAIMGGVPTIQDEELHRGIYPAGEAGSLLQGAQRAKARGVVDRHPPGRNRASPEPGYCQYGCPRHP